MWSKAFTYRRYVLQLNLRDIPCREKTLMTESAQSLTPLWRQLAWWTLVFPLVMLIALVQHNLFLLNWIHVLSGVLWTGSDLFMGFILGPVMRSLDISARTSVISFLVPRTLLFFPMVSLTTGTAGWFLANWLGFAGADSQQHVLVIVSLVMVTIMTIIGLGFLLPNSLRIWFELRQPKPDRERIVRINRTNMRLAGTQGVLQVAIILAMAHFVI